MGGGYPHGHWFFHSGTALTTRGCSDGPTCDDAVGRTEATALGGIAPFHYKQITTLLSSLALLSPETRRFHRKPPVSSRRRSTLIQQRKQPGAHPPCRVLRECLGQMPVVRLHDDAVDHRGALAVGAEQRVRVDVRHPMISPSVRRGTQRRRRLVMKCRDFTDARTR